jgi:VWFA-related protein
MRMQNLIPAVALCCATAVYGQAPPSGVLPITYAQVPVIKANTRAVAVDVVVTKGQDEPVTALRKQDFVLREDGKPQAIDFFEEHTMPVASAALAPLPAMPPHVYTNVPTGPQSDSVNVLLLDSLNTPRQDQSYVHQQIVAFLKTMKPDARIAIFTLGSKLRLIRGFSDDPAALRAAVDSKKFGFDPVTTNVSRTHQDDEEDQAEVAARQRNLGGQGRTTAGIAALQAGQAEFADFETDQRAVMTLEALQNLGRYLAGIPGRKNLIWFSSSYPVYFFPKSLEKQLFNSSHREFNNEIKQTADLLTLSKVAVYPIDAEGMMRNYKEDAEHYAGPGLLAYQEMANERAEKMSAMEQIAADTGGEAIFNSNDLNAALSRVIHNGDHYYTIVYTPTNKEMNGQFRKIDVKLNAGKFKLAYRRGYYADDAAVLARADNAKDGGNAGKSDTATKQDVNATTNRLQSMMVRGMPSSMQILYGVRVAPADPQPAANASRAGRNKQLTGPTKRYSVDFLIDAKMVHLEPTAKGTHSGQVQVELLAYDHDGKALNWAGGTLRMDLDAATYTDTLKSGLKGHAEIDVPDTDVYLATGVYDVETGKAGTLEVALNTYAKPATVAVK